MKTKLTRMTSILLAALFLIAMFPMQALALENGGAGGSEAGELQWICVSGTHSWDDGVVTTAATCTGTGVRTFTCTLCGTTKTENIAALGHAYGEWTETTAPTCGNPGERRRVCANDPTHVEVEVIAATGVHVPGELIPGTAATCTEAGTADHYVCQQCGANIDGEGKIINITVPATGHTVVEDAAVAPTCTETGLTAGSHCSVCNAVIVAQEVVPATGHTVVEDAAVPATCTETGLTAGSHCSVCNAVIVAQEVVPATGHTVVEDVAVPATCTETGLTAGSHCSVCNAVIVAQEVVPATGHTVVEDAAVPATCTETGLTAGSHCSVCNTVLVAQEVVPATGHSWVAFQEGDDITDFTLKAEATTESAAVYYKNCSVDGTSAKGIDEDATFTYGEPLPAEEPDIMYGDANGDGFVNGLDALLLCQVVAEMDVVLGPQS